MTSVLSTPSPSQDLSVQCYHKYSVSAAHPTQGFQRPCKPPQSTWLPGGLGAAHLTCPSSPKDYKGWSRAALGIFQGDFKEAWAAFPQGAPSGVSHWLLDYWSEDVRVGFRWCGRLWDLSFPSWTLHWDLKGLHIGGAWAPSHRMFLGCSTCTQIHALKSFVWKLGKSSVNMHWHKAWKDNLMNFPYSEPLCPRKASWPVFLLKRSVYGYFTGCLQDIESLMSDPQFEGIWFPEGNRKGEIKR